MIAVCPGCRGRHLLADRKGWFGAKGSIEEFLAERGEGALTGCCLLLPALVKISEGSAVLQPMLCSCPAAFSHSTLGPWGPQVLLRQCFAAAALAARPLLALLLRRVLHQSAFHTTIVQHVQEWYASAATAQRRSCSRTWWAGQNMRQADDPAVPVLSCSDLSHWALLYFGFRIANKLSMFGEYFNFPCIAYCVLAGFVWFMHCLLCVG